MTPGRKALIIDDSAMLLRYATSVLAARLPGLAVLTARRGGDGFYQADKLRPDLILVNHALPDMPGEALCRRLADHPGTAALPVVFLCGRGMVAPPTAGAGFPNVVGALTKPFTPEELFNAVRAALVAVPHFDPVPGDHTAAAGRGHARLRLPTPLPPAAAGERRADVEDAGRTIVFRGTTASFSLKTVLLAAVEAHHTGILRLTAVPAGGIHDGAEMMVAPTEVYLRAGQVALVTTRDPDLYGPAAPSSSPPADGADDALRREQRATGCPPFLALFAGGQLPEAEAWRATADHGQRLFSRLWSQPRLDFEFERLEELPVFVRRLPEPPPVAPAPAPDLDGLDETVRLDDWLLGTLRRLRPEELSGLAPGVHDGNRFDGVPAYTREGYTAIRRLRLTDLEVAFAQQVDGRADLRTLAGRLGLGEPAAFLLLFRFRSVGLMDLWPAGALAHHQAGSVPGDDLPG